jgi:hypothetical protein
MSATAAETRPSRRTGSLTPVRLITAGLALLFVVYVAAQVKLVASRDGMFYPGTQIVVGGDFLVFYTAGRIVAAGDSRDLYDPARQLREQHEILGRDRGLAIFPYPAFVAAPYALIARLPFASAYAIAVIAMMAATLVAILLLRQVSPLVRAHPWLIGLAVLDSQPFNAALFGGQTVAFTLMCFAGVYSGLRRDRPVAAGAWLGLLCYKPQMALLIGVLLVLQARWRVLAVAALVVCAMALVGVAVAGIDWPLRFLSLTTGSYYQENCFVGDGDRTISLPQLLTYLFGRGLTGGPNILTGVLFLATAGVLGWLCRNAEAASSRFSLLFAAVLAATLCCIGYTWTMAYDFGVSPMAVLPVWVGALAVRAIYRKAPENAAALGMAAA